jgi:hypothetical protein
MPPAEVTEKLQLSKLKDRVWYVVPSCATTGEGLFEGLVSSTLYPPPPHGIADKRIGLAIHERQDLLRPCSGSAQLVSLTKATRGYENNGAGLKGGWGWAKCSAVYLTSILPTRLCSSSFFGLICCCWGTNYFFFAFLVFFSLCVFFFTANTPSSIPYF